MLHIVLEPARGQAAIADQNGRRVLVIHAGTRIPPANSSTRPTAP
jgi:hypothetical protein